MRKRFKSFSEKYRGFEAEADVLDAVSPAARFNGEYKPYMESMKIAAANQPEGWNPEDPPVKPTSFPSDMHYFVGERLGEQFDLDQYTLRMFTSSKSTFDVKHGVDAFFTLTNSSNETVWATIDVTTNPEKDDYKADSIILLPENFADTEEVTADQRQKLEAEWAKEIAILLEERMKAKENPQKKRSA